MSGKLISNADVSVAAVILIMAPFETNTSHPRDARVLLSNVMADNPPYQYCCWTHEF